MKNMNISIPGHVFPIILICLENHPFAAGIDKNENHKYFKTKIEIEIISQCTSLSLYPDFSKNLAQSC